MSGSEKPRQTLPLLVVAGVVGAALPWFPELLAPAVPQDLLDRYGPWIATAFILLVVVDIALRAAQRGMMPETGVGGFQGLHPGLGEGQPGSLASLDATVTGNVELLKATPLAAAVDLLYLSVFLAPEPEAIPLKLVRAGAGALPRRLRDAVCDLYSLDQLTAALGSLSLVDLVPDGIRVRRSVQRIVRHHLGPAKARAWASRGVDVVLAALATTPADPGDKREVVAEILPHALAVLPHAEPEAALQLRIAIGTHLGETAGTLLDLEDALDYLSKAHKQAKRDYGADDPLVAQISAAIDAVYGRLGRSNIFRHARLGHLR